MQCRCKFYKTVPYSFLANLFIQRGEVDLISACMEGSMASVGGFCVGSSFIIEHQRLSGLGYCFSASLPPLLTQAAITALERFENEPQMFNELAKVTQMMHSKFSKFSKLKLGGDESSPVKHLYITNREKEDHIEQKLLAEIADEVTLNCLNKFSNGKININFYSVFCGELQL